MNLKNAQKITLLLLILFSSCKQSEESKVRKTAASYISGRIALVAGNNDELRAVTEDSLFKLLILKETYMKLAGRAASRADLSHIQPGTAEIHGNTATCQMNGEDHYWLNLYKYGETWKVKGENETIASTEKISEIEAMIKKRQLFLKDKPVRDSVMRVVNLFFACVTSYTKTGDTTSLATTCDSATLAFIKRFYTYAKQRTGEAILNKETEQYIHVAGDAKFSTNHAVFNFYEEDVSLTLQKIDDIYIVTGLNGIPCAQISASMMQKKYKKLLRSLKLIWPDSYRTNKPPID